MAMDLGKLRDLAGRYFDWIEATDLYVSPELAAYSPRPALTEEFVAYAAVPTKLFNGQEFFEIERLLGSDASDGLEQDYIRYLYHVLSARFANLTNERLQDDINIVSIGGNCVPRLLFSKWGLRKTRPLGARSLPFDLVWCEPDGVADILASDFAGMVDPLLLSSATKADVRESWTWFVGDVPIAVNNSLSVCYNHEPGAHWLDNNYANLIKRYDIRLRRFRDTLANGRPTIALMNHQRPFSRESYDRLLRGIERLATMAVGAVHVVCVVSAGDPSESTRERTIDLGEHLRLTVAYNPQPPEPYLFYMPASYASAAGLAWEAEFLRILDPVIEREAGLRISTGLR